MEHKEPELLRSAEEQEHFIQMFGVSPDDLAAQGIDIERYRSEHATAGIDHIYRSYQRRMAEGKSLLPYWAPFAWISRGVTMLAQSWMGSVSIDASSIRLEDGQQLVAECAPPAASVHSVPIWFGMGVRLDFKDQGSWYVQPRYSSTSMIKARRASAVLRSVLSEARDDDHRAMR
jgi:hypothetical protein